MHLTKAGRFRQAADREKEIGQIYQHELNNIAKACDSFQRAAEWYDQEDAAAYVQFLRSRQQLTFVIERLAHVARMPRTSVLKSKITEGLYNFTRWS
jgi:hypothetical protein